MCVSVPLEFGFAASNGASIGGSNASTWAEWISPTVHVIVGGGVLLGDGFTHADRVELTWPDFPIDTFVATQTNGLLASQLAADNASAYAAFDKWLQVSILPTATTGLASADLFYFGNAPAESGNSLFDAKVSSADEIAARNNGSFLTTTLITNPYDYNRDHKVNSSDEIYARNWNANLQTGLKLIAPTGTGPTLLAAPASGGVTLSWNLPPTTGGYVEVNQSADGGSTWNLVPSSPFTVSTVYPKCEKGVIRALFRPSLMRLSPL